LVKVAAKKERQFSKKGEKTSHYGNIYTKKDNTTASNFREKDNTTKEDIEIELGTASLKVAEQKSTTKGEGVPYWVGGERTFEKKCAVSERGSPSKKIAEGVLGGGFRERKLFTIWKGLLLGNTEMSQRTMFEEK